MKNKTQHSGYWLGKGFDAELDLEERGTSTATIIKLAAIKQSITNFVRIVTNKAIPVSFSSGKDSYTDGQRVVISASTKDKNFDAVVGLALHEASHIKLTDFTFLKGYLDSGKDMLPDSLKSSAAAKGVTEEQVKGLVSMLMNIVEDRRIDYFIYRTAPGYRPYYEAMYDHYFRNRQIDNALESGMMAKPTVDNYMFYITNMANPKVDVRHLPELDRIFGLIHLDKIERLDGDDFGYVRRQLDRRSSSFDLTKMPEIFRTCVQIAEIIFKNAEKIEKGQSPQSGQGGQSEDSENENKEQNMDLPRGSQGSGSGPQQESDVDELDEEEEEDSDNDDEDDVEGEGDLEEKDDSSSKKKGKGKGESSKGSTDDSEDDSDEEGDDKENESASDSESKDSPEAKKQPKVNKERLKKAIKQQKDFLNGDTKKKRLSAATDKKVKALEQSGASVTEIDHTSQYGGKTKTKVLVMRKLTKEIMESGAFPFTPSANYATRGQKLHLSNDYVSEQAVKDGFRAGAILAQRLSIRNQTQVTKFNRKDKGHLDKRRLSALGFDDDKVFFNLRVAAFKPVFVHMTLDCSGSMNGERWQKALTVAVAVAVAAEKVENLNVVVSMRGGVGDFATIAIIYDSRTDKPAKIKQLFKFLTTTGSTPEGLTFAAIKDEILNVKADERFFINLSDGEPAWTNYGGEPAWRHTREQVTQMRNDGIKILSYFVGDSYYGGKNRAFEVMYGKDASYINVTQVTSLISTLNRLFLQR